MQVFLLHQILIDENVVDVIWGSQPLRLSGTRANIFAVMNHSLKSCMHNDLWIMKAYRVEFMLLLQEIIIYLSFFSIQVLLHMVGVYSRYNNTK